MRYFLFIFFLILGHSAANCQVRDSATSLAKASILISSGKSVQEILMDTSFLFIHPHTPFRELIKSHAKGNVLQYVTNFERGIPIGVNCVVKGSDGKPVQNALVYCYQTDERGWYGADAPHFTGMEGDRRHARLFGYLITDNSGQFHLSTIHPRGYPNSNLPSHIHIEITAPGYNTIITEFLFDEDPRLTPEVRTRAKNEGFIIQTLNNGTYNYMLTMSRQ